MAHRQLYIRSAKRLSLMNDQLILTKVDDSQLSFPLEDFDLVFIEDPNATITINLITKASGIGCSFIVCGKDYLPKSQILPFNSYYLQSKILNLQLNLLPYKKKKLWETIVKQKIRNQITILETVGSDMYPISQLYDFFHGVKPGDSSNMEGIAAKIYFQSLFGKDFIRFSDELISIALNYGYSIIASQVIRTVAFNGLLDNLGIWHSSEKNNNNLSYDFIEPFRQVVDFYVFNNVKNLMSPLSSEIKLGLINLLNYRVRIDGNLYKVSYAIGITVSSYLKYMESGDITDIKLPSFELMKDTNESEL